MTRSACALVLGLCATACGSASGANGAPIADGGGVDSSLGTMPAGGGDAGLDAASQDGGAATAHVARAAKIFDQSQRIEKLIDDLLDISRITNHKVALEPEDFDLTDLVREVAERLAERAMQAGCELRVSATQPVHGRWDRARLDQIVTNLCTNAIKFGAGKPIDLTVTFDARVGPGSSTGPTAILSVRDSGIGISAQDRERIFGRFERAVSVRHYGGFGLGLWIVRQIVERARSWILLHGGAPGSLQAGDLPLKIHISSHSRTIPICRRSIE